MNLSFNWSPITRRHDYGSECKVGLYVLGRTSQPTQTRAYTGPRWKAEVVLPGIKIKSDLLFEREDEAMACVERVIETWFKRMLE